MLPRFASVPPRARLRRAACLLSAAAALVGLLASPSGAQQGDGGGGIEVLEVSGVIDRTVAGFVVDTISAAQRSGSTAVVIQLDAPGGIGGSAVKITEAITGSTVPVVVWVGPPGARALGAGAFVAQAAHVLAMAPGAAMGAAAPADLSGDEDPQASQARLVDLARLHARDETFARAAAEDGAAVVAGAPGIDGDLAPPPGVDPDRTLLLSEAELAERRIVDFVAISLPDVLRELDGREVRIAATDGQLRSERLRVDVAAADVRFHSLGLVRRVLHTVADPTLAYLLIIAGALALAFEVFQPGFGVAGVSGAVVLALGVFGLAVLPTSWLALGILALGMILLAVDLALAGFGPLTLAGGGALTVGSMLLFTSPALRVPAWLIATAVLGTLVFFVVIMTAVLRAQASPPAGARERLIGQVGVVRSMLNPEGHIFVSDALWRARAPEGAGTVRTGTRVRVVELDESGTLRVEQIDAGHLEESAQT